MGAGPWRTGNEAALFDRAGQRRMRGHAAVDQPGRAAPDTAMARQCSRSSLGSRAAREIEIVGAGLRLRSDLAHIAQRARQALPVRHGQAGDRHVDPLRLDPFHAIAGRPQLIDRGRVRPGQQNDAAPRRLSPVVQFDLVAMLAQQRVDPRRARRCQPIGQPRRRQPVQPTLVDDTAQPVERVGHYLADPAQRTASQRPSGRGGEQLRLRTRRCEPQPRDQQRARPSHLCLFPPVIAGLFSVKIVHRQKNSGCWTF